jgi:hypothetical protein
VYQFRDLLHLTNFLSKHFVLSSVVGYRYINCLEPCVPIFHKLPRKVNIFIRLVEMNIIVLHLKMVIIADL